MRRHRWNLLNTIALTLLLALWIGSYFWWRNTDILSSGRPVIFLPRSFPVWMVPAYQPLAIVEELVTGQEVHIFLRQ